MDIWTIGHSTLTIEQFVARLQSFRIDHVADIRQFPGSRRYPHFNSEQMVKWLADANIAYSHHKSLGGRRKSSAGSIHTEWRNLSFRGYADYMDTPAFAEGIAPLEDIARNQRLAYMCSEAPWWRCHRALVSDYLKARGWNVCHIMDVGKCTPHPYTAPAREAQGRLFQG